MRFFSRYAGWLGVAQACTKYAHKLHRPGAMFSSRTFFVEFRLVDENLALVWNAEVLHSLVPVLSTHTECKRLSDMTACPACCEANRRWCHT